MNRDAEMLHCNVCARILLLYTIVFIHEISNARFALYNRPLAKVPNTPPPTPPRLRGGERLLYSNAGWGSLFLIYARSLI